jgi:hypothetical protein
VSVQVTALYRRVDSNKEGVDSTSKREDKKIRRIKTRSAALLLLLRIFSIDLRDILVVVGSR